MIFKSCPARDVSRQSRQLLNQYLAFHNYSVLPYAGGWSDQPLPVTQAFDRLRPLMTDYIEKERQKAKGAKR